MEIVVAGVNHKTASLAVREKLALGRDQLTEALSALCQYVPQGAILSTCNRAEVYAAADHHTLGVKNVRRFIFEYYRISPLEVADCLYTYSGEDAVRHLFRVASGIDSMILGESQILGQVRGALEEAEAAGALPFPLSNLFRHALRVGRTARGETAISRNSVSVSATAVALAKQIFGDITQCKVLVISMGEAGKLTAKTLKDSGVAEIVVTSRTFDRAAAMAEKLGGRAIALHHMGEALAECDIVISASGSPHFVLEPPLVREAMSGRERPLFLIDIAVPRDVDPDVKSISNVYLYDIDDLQAVSDANLREREGEVEKVEAIIDEEVVKFSSWWRSLDVVPTITALRRRAEAIRQSELRKTLPRLRDLSPVEQASVDAMTKAIVRKLLHDPTIFLKKHRKGTEYAQALRQLFDLGTAPEADLAEKDA
ncbi:MAG: glutamyl-tRNA reductase [Chloroflexi bacterium]|nr:glutamyl-tRNA reductase [Chloroflexota bacterium]